MAKKEEWQKKSEASPHPGLESLCRDTKLFTWGTWQNVSQNLSTKPDRAAKPRKKKKTKRKASIPPSAQRMLTTQASKKDLCKMDLQGFRQDDYSAAANLVNSFQHLLKSCDADWQLQFSPLPHLLSQTDSLLQMVQQLKCLQTHPLWGPADFFLPKLGAGTSSHSGSNTGGTGQNLGERQQKEKCDAQHRLKWWKWNFFFKELKSDSAFKV